MSNQRLPISIPPGVAYVLDRLCDAGHDAWLVGGCLRDACLGRIPKDWDVATSALPAEIEGIFPRTAPTGIRYGTVTVLTEGMGVEVTTFRSEGAYQDSRHPGTVAFESSIEADLSRRDFTVNAMAYHPDTGWYDPFGGRADCERGIIRCVGEPGARFGEDALRMLRAVRFAAQLGFSIHADTLRAIRENASAVGNVAGERTREELVKILRALHAGIGIDLLGESGLGRRILPQAASAVFSWNPDSWPQNTVLRLCGLLSAAYGDREDVGAVLRRLRFDNATKADVYFLYDTKDILPVAGPEWVRRRLYEWGERRMAVYLDFQQAEGRPVGAVRKNLAGVMERGECVSLKDLALNGADLIECGVEPGPVVGEALERLMDVVLCNPSMNDREKLIAYIKELEKKGRK